MQFIPFETHLTPVMALEHEALVVSKESVHYLSLQTDEVELVVLPVVVVVAH